MIDFFKYCSDVLSDIRFDSLSKTLLNVHHDGLHSLVIQGVDNGNLLRVFIATEDIEPLAISLHSHKYSLDIGVVNGGFTHYMAIPTYNSIVSGGIGSPKYKYISKIDGDGGFKYIGDIVYNIHTYPVPAGSVIHLSNTDIHSVSCKKGTIWIINELGNVSDSNIVVGSPFATDNMYLKPTTDQISGLLDIFSRSLRHLINKLEV